MIQDTNIIERNFCDKRNLLSGVWMTEPDMVEWIDIDTGLPCVVLRDPKIFSLGGYIGIPQGHRFHGLPTEGIYDLFGSKVIEVHYGLTSCCVSDEYLYHSRADMNTWWVGFDCSHGVDLVPYFMTLPGFKDSKIGRNGIYRSVSFAMYNCRKLATQLL